MKIKKYEVSDIKEALRMIRQDLGPDAVILSTRKIMKTDNFGLFARPLLEVTAALDYKVTAAQFKKNKNEIAPTKVPRQAPREPEMDDEEYSVSYQPSYFPKTKADIATPIQSPRERALRENQQQAPTRRETIAPITSEREERKTNDKEPTKEDIAGAEKLANIMKSLGLDKFSDVMTDLSDIKKQISDMKATLSDNMVIDLPTRLKEYHATLVKNGVDDLVSYRALKNLSKRVSDTLSNAQLKSAVTDMLADLVAIDPNFEKVFKSRVIALTGPTGVGKTTTIAKIAATMAMKNNFKVCLITIDNFRIGAIEQLKTYAEIVNIPLYVAMSPDELSRILDEVRSSYDCVLIDSMGRSQFDMSQIDNIRSFVRVSDDISVVLVLSMASNHVELYDVVERYSGLEPEYLILTKLDETRYFGALLNLPVKKKIPLLLFSTGQNVPDDMEVPDGKKIAKKILQEIPTVWDEL